MSSADDTQSPPLCRAIRGAICADSNTPAAIIHASRDLLCAAIQANDIRAEDIVSILFTTTPDLDAAYPAVAARDLGLADTALMCLREMLVAGSLERCIRVLIHWNTTRSQRGICHVYVGQAAQLRPDRRWPPLQPEEDEPWSS